MFKKTPECWCALLIIVVVAGALLFRLPRLEQRPMHTDEAVHAVKLGILIDKGTYVYDPHEYHGPTSYYASFPFVRLSGAKSFREIPDEFPLRIVPVLFGTGLVLLLLCFKDGLGARAAVCAGLLTAVSPAMVFYSRYYIQEMLLVFFTFAAIVTGWRYSRTKRLGWALLAGACLGLMHATKETSVIAYGAMLGGGVLTMSWSRWIDGRELRLRNYMHGWHVAGAVKVAIVIALFLLTAFLSNPAATLDAIRSYGLYLERAGSGENAGEGIHSHPWYYYLQMLLFFRSGAGPWWSEGMILALALTGIITVLMRKPNCEGNVPLLRFLAFYTLLMTLVYSFIPYKTPWCMLGFLHGMILMAGVGTVAVYESLRNRGPRVAVALLFALGVFHLGVQARRGSFVFYADTRNPYVYAHTSTDLLNLVERLEDLAKVHPDGHGMLVKVIVPESDYWPLPWYLRRFENVGYWNEVPDDSDAPVVITMPVFETELDHGLGEQYQKEFYGLRPEVLTLVYIQESLWDQFIRTREGS